MELRPYSEENMAIITGGLHGRPSGNVAGVVYGAARTRTGKAVTARELVYPSNPKTPGQVLQRAKFSEALNATRLLGATLWQDDFNRAIGQLPGFQCMMSIILNGTNAAEEFVSPADTPLGNLHFPGTFTCVTGVGAGGTVTLDWTAEVGINGTVADDLEVFMVAKDAGAGNTRHAYDMIATTTRATTTLVAQTGVAGTDIVIGVYWKGAGTADGLYSLCRWFDVTTHA